MASRPPRGTWASLPIFQLLLCLLPIYADPSTGVSFFGDDYVEIPGPHSYSSIHLHMEFVTRHNSAVLFLAAGQKDYLLLELYEGVLQAKMDLGSGDLSVMILEDLQLHKFQTHEVDLLVKDGKMTLIVDGVYNASTEIPEPLQELDIDYGLYVGTGDLELTYLGGVRWSFRGCLLNLTFNGRDILLALATGNGVKATHGIREGCSKEFSAGPGISLGFLGSNAYIAFPGWDARNEGTIEFVITTSVKHTPLFYQSGMEKDFFYLEIFDGHLRGVVEKGNGLVLLHNNVFLSDERDHYVKVYVDNRKFEILVDYYASQTASKWSHAHFDFQGPLFLGGLNEKAASSMKKRGLDFISENSFFNNSFVGCIEDLSIDEKKMSLRDALVTKDIGTGCGKSDQYSDYDNVYEQDEATTSSPLDSWQGSVMEPCRPDPNLPPVFNNFTKLLHVNPLTVTEGGTAFLQLLHTQPTIDLKSANIRQSQVLFSVATGPRHGQLELNLSKVRSGGKFTLLDIVNRKVKYVHDGSEEPMDQLLLEVTVTTRGDIPECLGQGQIYLLLIKIIPVNDAPEVVFPHGNSMVILERSQKRLNPTIFHARDDDTPCDGLRFQVLDGKTMEGGYLEYDSNIGIPIEEFSCRDLEAGQVTYVHQDSPVSTLRIQVNDGMVMSPVATLRINAVKPDIQIRNNTGLFVLQGDNIPITSANLSVHLNVVQQEVAALYHLVSPLQYGEIQKQREMNGEWTKTEYFYQNDIDQGRVQYASTDDEHRVEDTTEKLQLTIMVGRHMLKNNTFLIRIQKAAIRMKTKVPLQMKNQREKNITSAELEAVLEEPDSEQVTFHYVILQPPKKGNLELRGTRLGEGLSFNQEDLQRGQLSYIATVRDSKETEDVFQFRVMATPYYSPVYSYKIEIGGDPDTPVLTNALLSVLEGGQATITKDYLFVKSANSINYVYEVIDGPTHGKLIWSTPGSTRKETITTFTNEDILEGQLVYQHDDSETLEDDIPFVAIKQEEGSFDSSTEDVRGVFRVSIQPVNDHIPVQVVNKVFNVVRKGQRLMTTEDIAFTDEDSGFSDIQLVLVRKDILFGSIIAADDRNSQLYRFTQDDLRNKKILFVHSGADRGGIQFQVSDGLHQITTLLEVQASEPYLKFNHTGLVLHQGSQKAIDSSVLKLETNMDIRNDQDFIFRILAPPISGMLLRDGQEVSSFTKKDLLAGDIIYHHNGSRKSQDAIHFSVEANQLSVEGTLKVTILADSHPDPLNLVHNEKIPVLQGEVISIKNDYLLVEHDEIEPQNIIYTIVTFPISGFLGALSQKHALGMDHLLEFTQEDVNEGRILFLHHSPEYQKDQFTVDVTADGVDALNGVVVDLEILPLSLPLEVHNFTVTEGHSQVLSMDILNIPSTYTSSFDVEFVVVEMPEHGSFQNIEGPEEGNLSVFSWEEVENQLIQYVHDGSESLTDRFTIIANVSEVNQQNQPKTIYISISPVNDEAPVLMVNKELQMEEGGTAEITPEILQSEDEDSTQEEVVYSIRTPVNGKVVLKSSPNNPIQRFTQAQINSHLVLYIHKGPPEGGFSFDLSDGENMSPGHFFAVKVQNKFIITLENKQNLMVCPGSSEPIRSQNLKAVTNRGEAEKSLLYIIQRPPEFGKLLNSQKSNGEELRNFTQAEVNAGVIVYHHEMPREPFWIYEDNFHFQISSPSGTTDLFVLGVEISFEAACPEGFSLLWKNKGLTVPEAQSAAINISVLDASNLLAKVHESMRIVYDVVFLVTKLPMYGEITLPDGRVNKRNPYFLQSDLAAGGLEYSHNGPGFLDDYFRFEAWLNLFNEKPTRPPQKGKEVVISGVFNITVKDSNEMPPKLVSQEKVLQVLQGSSMVITQDHLNVIDPDSFPEEIQFNISSESSTGFIAMAHNTSVAITQFTQADIIAGHLIFVASRRGSTGTLKLVASDGFHKPISISLEIMVLPAATWAANQTILEVPQDLNMALLSHQHLLGSLDQREENTSYELIRDPEYGQVEVHQKAVRRFSQQQVDNGEVSFTFTDLASSKDEFQFLATSGGINISGIVNVTVKALVKTQQDILWPRGATVQLNTNVLDARDLANKTESIPEFRILQPPQGSNFVRYSTDHVDRPFSTGTFTQDDLEKGLIGLEIWEAENSGPNLQEERFQFELFAKGVPPALGWVVYTTESFNSSTPYRATWVKKPGLEENSHSSTPQSITSPGQTFTTMPYESKMPHSTANKSHVLPTTSSSERPTSQTEKSALLGFIEANMFSIILPICLILLLLALILPLLFYLHKRNKTGKHNVQGTPPKYKNGTVVDQETFRKTDPSQNIPLTTINTLEAKEPGSNSKGPGPGREQDPELLQYCRTSNPALKNSQYWV
ncbi:chondroitin sulfate proteoglycan 4 [Erythrolamprus reginae]|uniref:chondroitin sulfate proteoglycan 4 n=1 Tax=Erythrolamprus reginae TaxID=121349 RepID=UPI00396CB015